MAQEPAKIAVLTADKAEAADAALDQRVTRIEQHQGGSMANAPTSPQAPNRPPPPTPAQIDASRRTQGAGTGRPSAGMGTSQARQAQGGAVRQSGQLQSGAQLQGGAIPGPGQAQDAAVRQPGKSLAADQAALAPSLQRRTAAIPVVERPPQARIAQTAGVLLHEEDYDRAYGIRADGAGRPLTQPAPTITQEMARVTYDATMVPAAQLDANTARARLTKMVGDLRSWIAANPHSLDGENAAVAAFFKELETRRLARANATALGRPVDTDEIDDTTHAPPPEFFVMVDLAQQAEQVLNGYQAMTTAAIVPEDLQKAADGLRKRIDDLMRKVSLPRGAPTPEVLTA